MTRNWPFGVSLTLDKGYHLQPDILGAHFNTQGTDTELRCFACSWHACSVCSKASLLVQLFPMPSSVESIMARGTSVGTGRLALS